MNDYDPESLSRKWRGNLTGLLEETRQTWARDKPRKRFLRFRLPEPDASADSSMSYGDKERLLYDGEVVWGLFVRAFFPAYIPGRNIHYGSAVYSLNDQTEERTIFEVAFNVNELRANSDPPPPEAKTIAMAMRNDRSSFVRFPIPAEVGGSGDFYLGNICIHRTRLPCGFIHDRLVPVLVAPKKTKACCLLPLRFWPVKLQQIWSEGEPAYPANAFDEALVRHKIKP